jgi:ABC-type amino acid transport system permease subunit
MRGLIHEIGFWTWIAIVAACCAIVAIIVLVFMCCKTNLNGAGGAHGSAFLTIGSGGSHKVDLVRALDEIAELRDS